MKRAKAEPDGLSALALDAGIAEHWSDARQRPQQVSPDTLRTLLAAMDLPAATARDIEESRRRLAEQAADALPPMLVTRCGARAVLPKTARGPYRILCESGRILDGHIQAGPDGLPFMVAPDEPGYHRLLLTSAEATLAVAPQKAPSLADLTGVTGPRCWGLAAQVYSLRQDARAAVPRTHGFGDFGALRELAVAAAEQGADMLAISPVHAMYTAQPERSSPYSPSNRLFLNVLYAAPASVLGQDAMMRALSDVEPAELTALDGLDLIDWPAAAAVRLRLLRALHAEFARSGAGSQRARYAQFCEDRGQALRDHAIFEALHAAQRAPDGTIPPWQKWPAALRDPASAQVRRFAQDHPLEVDFHQFAQWLAAENLAAAHTAGREAGMRLGLLADLAVGASPDGSHAWSRQADLMRGMAVGAPPDIYNPLGQGWGLTAFSPRALHTNGYAAFIEMLRAVLAHTGGVRIDHILGMARLWLVPEGGSPADGAYLRYPLDEMLALIALEAWRHRACAIGENLGTVPEGFDDRLKDNGVLGMNVLWFMRQAPDAQPASEAEGAKAPGAAAAGGQDRVQNTGQNPGKAPGQDPGQNPGQNPGKDPGPDAVDAESPACFTPPADWPENAAAMTTTHDLPTLRGWWEERDIDWRVKLDLLGEEDDEASLRAARAQDREMLSRALDPAVEKAPVDPPVPELLRFVSSSPCPLLLVPMEDIAGVLDQPNLPGTIDTHPNWRQRLPLSIRATFADPAAQIRLDAARAGRRQS